MTKFLLMNWANTGGNLKSEGEVTRLAQEVLSAPDFNVKDLRTFNAHQENKRLDDALAVGQSNSPFSMDGWTETSVDIRVPVPSKSQPPKRFRVSGLHHRSIVQVVKASWGEVTASQFHLTPFKRLHINPVTLAETRIFDEAYTSDAWIQAHDELQRQPNEPGCQLEKVIVGLMIWSDSTRLAQFGTAQAWPVYLYFGNQSKYVRARPNSGACHQIAYVPSVIASLDLHSSFSYLPE
jgi:hypothetical protein